MLSTVLAVVNTVRIFRFTHIFLLVDCLIDSWCVDDGALSIDSVRTRAGDVGRLPR